MEIDSLLDLRAAQMRDTVFQSLLSGDELAKLAGRYSIGHFTADDVHALWSIGLLRADYVSCESPQERPGLQPVQASEYVGTYLDARVMQLRDSGLGSAAAEVSTLDEGWVVLFHPFRLFVLYHVQRVFAQSTSSTQFLTWQPGVQRLASRHEASLVRSTSRPEFSARFQDWNVICEAAVVTEPMQQVRFVAGVPFQSEAHPMAMKVFSWLRQLGQFEITKMREELGRAAEDMDPNTRVQTLMRLTSEQHRTQLKGRLGACMQFLNMAECIRRAAESALERNFPEEDEIGWGTWKRGARQMLYGTDRVFDAGFGEVRDF